MPHIEGRHSSPERKNQEFKKIGEGPLSEERFGDHLAAYGNHEGKAGLLASMKPDTPYTSKRLDSLANPDEKQIWSSSVPIAWCSKSLAPIGLVARELVDSKRGFFGYEKTKEGEELGEAFGGHLLELSEKLPVSLYQLSGSTMSSSKTKNHETEKEEQKERAPLTRFRIAKKLVTSELPIREVDLITSLRTDYPGSYEYDNIRPVIGTHLRNLATDGVITYKNRKADGDFSFYSPVATRPDGHLEPYGTLYSLTYQVDRLLSQVEEPLSIQGVYAALVQQHPEYRNNKEDSLTRHVSKVLAHLAREGYATHEGFSTNVQSAITLTPPQKEILGRFVDLGEKFRSLDRDFLKEGREKARVIVADKERFSALMEKAHNASKYTQNIDPSETGQKILAYVKDNPGVTNNDIQTYLQESRQTMSTKRIGELTRSLRADGKLIGKKEKHSMHYSLPEKPQISTEETVIFGPDTSV